MNAVGFDRILRERPASSQNVDPLSDRFQVRGVDTGRVSAKMIKDKPFWDGALCPLVGQSMSQGCFMRTV